MKERVVRILRPTRKHKKYKAVVRDTATGRTRAVHFGQAGAAQYRDGTPLRDWAAHDHRDAARRRSYFRRHSGVASKAEALRIEKRRSGGRFTPKLLSHIYLW